MCPCPEEIFRRSVTKLEYVDAETLVSSSQDGTMRALVVAIGAQKEELDGGSFALPKKVLRSSVPHTSSPR
jgi:hypothetical protein